MTDPVPVSRSRRRRLLVAASVVVLGLVAVGAAVFQPWKLIVDVRVDEARPTVAPVVPTTVPAPGTEPGVTTASPAPAPPERSGTFVSHNHPTAGTATLLAVGDRAVVRLEAFETDNGPDVVVELSSADSATGSLGADHLFLGELKGNVGNQNYEVPEGTDLDRFRSVVIWCRRFNVAFGSAPIVPAPSTP